jgi:hypothetical protein
MASDLPMRPDEALSKPKMTPEEQRAWLAGWREMVGDQLLGGYATGPHHPPRPYAKGTAPEGTVPLEVGGSEAEALEVGVERPATDPTRG